jgi:hypothetical protein
MRVLLSEVATIGRGLGRQKATMRRTPPRGRSFILNQRYTASLCEHGEFRKIAFSVGMLLFPSPFAECNIVSGLLERPKIHFMIKDIKK